MAFGAIFVLESRELTRVTGDSNARKILILVAPLAGLSLTNFSMFSRSLGRKDLALELLIVSVSYLFFLTITLPFALKGDPECQALGYFCEETNILVPIVSTVLLLIIFASAVALLMRRIGKVFEG